MILSHKIATATNFSSIKINVTQRIQTVQSISGTTVLCFPTVLFIFRKICHETKGDPILSIFLDNPSYVGCNSSLDTQIVNQASFKVGDVFQVQIVVRFTGQEIDLGTRLRHHVNCVVPRKAKESSFELPSGIRS